MPPAPRVPTISYGPSRVPMERVIWDPPSPQYASRERRQAATRGHCAARAMVGGRLLDERALEATHRHEERERPSGHKIPEVPEDPQADHAGRERAQQFHRMEQRHNLEQPLNTGRKLR